MKPRLLEIEAMGPFGGQVVVDFDDLAADGLFLIHGRTGAGKTSLLDAICFALYGEVPGVRKGKPLRSHHAAHNAAPFVSLEFDAQGGRYRVQRTASWEAPKKRGTGTTTKPPTAALHRIDRGSEELISNRNAEVTGEVRNLVGLTALQFQQVILLPQGKFEKVLQASSKEREQLFETLFDTVEYKQAEQWLESEARRRGAEVARLREQLAVVVDEATRRTADVLIAGSGAANVTVEAEVRTDESAGADDATTERSERTERTERPERPVSVGSAESMVPDGALAEGSETAAPGEAGKPAEPGEAPGSGAAHHVVDSAAVDATDPSVTQRLVDRLALASTEAAVAADRAGTELDRTRLHLEGARAISQRVARRSALEQQEAALVAAAPDIAVQRRVHAEADDAERLRPTLEEVTRGQDVVNKVQITVEKDLAAAGQAIAALPFTLDAVTALDLATVPGRSALSTATLAVEGEHATFTGLRRQARELADATAEHEKALGRRSKAQSDATEIAGRVQRATALLPEVDQQIQASRRATAELPALRAAAAETVARAESVRLLVEIAPKVEEAETVYLQARHGHLDARDAKHSLMERYLDGIAANLAGRLELDVACLVCGSPEHPQPAEPAPDAVTDAHIEAAEDRVEQAFTREKQANDRHQELLTQRAVLQARVGDQALDVAAAERGARAAKGRLSAATAEADALDGLLQGQQELIDAIAQDRSAGEAVAAAIAAAEAAAAGLAVQIDTARAALAARLGPDVPLEAAITSVEQVRAALGRVGEHAESTDDARSKLDQATSRAAEAVAASRFATAHEALAAQLADADRAALLARIKAHETDLDTVTTRLADDEFVGLPHEAPDTEGLEQQVAAAAADHEALVERAALTRAALISVTDLAERHHKLADETGAAVAEADLYQAVFARCTGRVAPKVALQRWVLASHLQEVCIHANRRLAAMTGGRYQLRVERLGSWAGAQAGLDLRVHDANTNQEREVSSLSGGETFQASLALALGVADSVEAHTGGIRLDALFIDEGFGTLDPDSLELAMDELDALRAGGRMVGVISHVTTLKERIRLGIEVTPGDDGSTVQVGDVPAQ